MRDWRRDAYRHSLEKKMLSRKVVTRSGRGFRGYYPSKKLNRLVQFESILERDAIQLFEQAEAVSEYREQPTIIYYHDEDGQPRKYYPDFEVILEAGDIVHAEVKPAIKLLKADIAKKYSTIHQHYLSRIEHFVILTEKELRGAVVKDIYQLINHTMDLQQICGGL
jgi:hypothetical protein